MPNPAEGVRIDIWPYKLKEIRGSVAAEVLTPHQPLITVDDILHAADKKVAGADGGSVNVLEVKRDDKGQVVLRVAVEKAPTPQTVPTIADPSVQAAAQAQQTAAAMAAGRNSTLLTSGQGVPGPATVAKKVLLGGG